MRKTSVYIVILAMILLISTATAAGVVVTVNSATAGTGTSATLPVSVSGASNLGAMDVVITYDPAVLKFSKAELGDLSTNGIVEANELQAGTTKISFADTKGISGDGTILKLTFDVIGAKGTTTNIGVSAQAYGLDLKDIPTTAKGGTVTAKSGIEMAVILLAIGLGIVAFSRRRD
jgi:hypothetical protein